MLVSRETKHVKETGQCTASTRHRGVGAARNSQAERNLVTLQTKGQFKVQCWPICAVMIKKFAVMKWMLCSDEFFHISAWNIWMLTFSAKDKWMLPPISIESMLGTPSSVTGNFIHFIKLKFPLHSCFQQNIENDIQFRRYLEEKRDYCQTRASKWNEPAMSTQRLKSNRKITFFETVLCLTVLD